MEKVKILVVEDEILIADNICDILEELGYEALEPVINYTEAIKSIEEEQPDIAILDIQLSGKKTGIDIAQKIRDSYNFPFIFLTSNTDLSTINLAKKVNPPAYLAKPFTKEDLFTAIEIALSNFSSQKSQEKPIVIKDALFIKEKSAFFKLLFDDIVYIKSDHVYVEIYLKNSKKYVVRNSLQVILESLNTNFVRVHRGYIVNLLFLKKIEGFSATINDTILPISKKYKEDLLEKLNIL